MGLKALNDQMSGTEHNERSVEDSGLTSKTIPDSPVSEMVVEAEQPTTTTELADYTFTSPFKSGKKSKKKVDTWGFE
jgi:hypothetical protein